MKSENLKQFIMAALFAALTFVATCISLPIGSFGYVHIGDAVIYFAAATLPLGYALPAAVIGAGLCDLALGYVAYIPATVIIKALIVLAIKLIIRICNGKIKPLAVSLAGIITVLGYYFADVLLLIISASEMSAAFMSSLGGIGMNFLQALASAVLFAVLLKVKPK